MRRIFLAWAFTVGLSCIIVVGFILIGGHNVLPPELPVLGRLITATLIFIPILLFLIPSAFRGIRYLKHQETFYRINFDEEMQSMTLKKATGEMTANGHLLTSDACIGEDWYISVENLRLLAFKAGFITKLENYRLLRRGYSARVTALCLDGKKRLIQAHLGEIERLRTWVEKHESV